MKDNRVRHMTFIRIKERPGGIPVHLRSMVERWLERQVFDEDGAGYAGTSRGKPNVVSDRLAELDLIILVLGKIALGIKLLTQLSK